ncbi:MAG: hypothetical protein JXM72_08250 [Deltaproteobacteria bacterium]|nr:hypothetical protein [Deltaproteobacteria bacterium]
MTPNNMHPKKEPKYLEDITYTIAADPLRDKDDLFLSSRFLGIYDEKQIMKMLEKVGIVAILYKKGYRNLIITVSKQDNYTSRLYVNHDVLEKDTRLIELIIREGVFRPKEHFVDGFDFSDGLSMLLVEWLALQDPKASYNPAKPRLPGQAYPGLGGLKNMQAMLYSFGKTMNKDAIIDIPEYYHAAVIYARMYSEIYSRMYSFFSPVDAGRLQAMIRDLYEKPLAMVSSAITFDCLLDADTGEKAHWSPSEQIFPISKRLKAYVGHAQYHAVVERTINDLRFTMDWEKYASLMEQGITDEI